jgi:hypothetical protein
MASGDLPSSTCPLPVRPLTVSVKVAAGALGLGLTTVWGLISAQELEVIRVGRRTLVVVASMERFVERCQQLVNKEKHS